MAHIHDDAGTPDPGWERECLRAARQREGRRLGDNAALRKRLGSTLRPTAPPPLEAGQDGLEAEVPAASWHRRPLTDD